MIYIQSIDSQEERSKFEELYSRYRDVMLWTAGKLLSNWADAEDAVHQAFVSVIENLHKISQPESPETRAFLIIITERKAIDILRDKKHFSSAELDLTAPGLELPRLKDSVSVSTLAAREEVVGDGRGLSAADCRELVNSRDDLQSVLDNKFSDVNGLRQDTLQNVAIMGAAVFVDKDNASCSFDSAEFAELLSLCKSIEANPDSSGDDFLLNSAGFDLSWLEERLGPCSFVGYPDGGDGLHFYILPNDFTYAVTMAIPTGSQNKEGAWYYIKSKLSRSSQLKLANEGRGLLPVMYEPAQDFISQNFEADQAQSIFGLLERTKYSELYGGSVLRDMIIDSSQAYLAGSKSLEETVQLIQGKASVYVAERYA